MRIVLILGVVALALYLAARQFDWLTSPAASNGRQGAAALVRRDSDTTCGVVADVRAGADGHGPATFVDLGRPHPIETLQIVIRDRDFGRFDPPPASWEGKRICVTGAVRTDRGRPEIVARDPDQIRPAPH